MDMQARLDRAAQDYDEFRGLLADYSPFLSSDFENVGSLYKITTTFSGCDCNYTREAEDHESRIDNMVRETVIGAMRDALRVGDRRLISKEESDRIGAEIDERSGSFWQSE